MVEIVETMASSGDTSESLLKLHELFKYFMHFSWFNYAFDILIAS